MADITHWRDERRIRIGYDPARYELPALRRTQSSFMQPQMMLHDRYFYDPVAGKYTVDRYLDDLEKRYGGIDAVLIWATYPNMGIDDRNQHEIVRSMPGGFACPWENDPKDAPAPIPDKERVMCAASDVDAHPNGASPFGVMDMVGNVWQWSEEYVDEHTRAAILRGGSHYQPQGSIWYFPQANKNDQHGKLLLMAPSYDRSVPWASVA